MFDDLDEDDYAFKADHELGEAPIDPPIYEGGFGKPRGAIDGKDMTKWCYRQCERCETIVPGQPVKLPDFSKRYYNQPFKHGIEV